MAVLFDKELTFKQRLSQYDKESLKVIAEQLGLRRLSKLKKAELIDLVAERFLDPEILFYRAAILGDKEMDLIEKGSGNGPIVFSPEDYDWIGRLNEMDFVAASSNLYMIPCDLAEALEKIRTPEFEAYRKRASWVWKCLKFAEHFYGFTPIENMLDLVNSKKGFRMTAQELIEMFDHFPEGPLWTIRIEDIFLEMSYAHDVEGLRRLRTAQADKEFYVPSVAEVNEFYETDALLSDKPYQDLMRFVMHEFDFDHADAEDLMYELWDKNAYDEDPHGTMQWFWDQFEFEDEKQVQKIVGLYTIAANETRMIKNRGHKPNELHSKRHFGPGHMPTIQAGSSHAAEMLSQIAPEIQKMGFGLDLDSNADTMPVMGFPNGLNSQPVVAAKKIYPNDPCPCGSGKKYKKCCGR